MTADHRLYTTVNRLIVSALMYDNLAKAIATSVLTVGLDALKRGIENHNATMLTDEALTDLLRSDKDIERVCEDAFEKIMDTIGNGKLKDAVFSLIISANQYGWNLSTKLK